MGGSSSKEIEIEIRNEINSNFENLNKNINDMINNTITNITNKMINEIAIEIRQSTGGSNVFSLTGGLDMSGASVFDVTQTADVKSTNDAVVKIVNDSDALKELQSKITGEVMNKILNDSAAQANLKAVNELTNKKTNEGGDALVAKAMDAFAAVVGSITGADTKESISQKIINQMGIDIKNTNINENIVKNIIENNIETIIQNISKNQCITNTTGNNDIVIEGGIKTADTANFTFNQIYNVNALNKCLMDQSNKVKTTESLANSQDVLTKTDTANKAQTEVSMDTQNKAENVEEQKSFLATAVKAFTSMGSIIVIAVVVIVIILAIVLFIYLKNGGTLPDMKNILKPYKIGGVSNMPTIPTMPNMPSMPNMSAMSSMPNMPTIPKPETLAGSLKYFFN
jgi:hypothetical protein